MPPTLFPETYTSSNRIIYTPSEFAKSSLLYLQETGELTAQRPHTKSRSGLDSYLFFIFVYGMFGNVEFYYDSNKFTMFISLFGAGLNLLLNYIAIPVFGYVAAGYTTLICYVVFSIGHLLYMNFVTKKKIGRKIYNPYTILLMSVAVIILSIIVSLLYFYTVLRYVIVVLILLTALIERKKLKSIIKMILKKNDKLIK